MREILRQLKVHKIIKISFFQILNLLRNILEEKSELDLEDYFRKGRKKESFNFQSKPLIFQNIVYRIY
jgi:hypothetical protein